MMSANSPLGAPRRRLLLLAAFGAGHCALPAARHGGACADTGAGPGRATRHRRATRRQAAAGNAGKGSRVRRHLRRLTADRRSFSYTDEEGKVTATRGICANVSSMRSKARLNLPGLQVVPVLATPSTRLR